MTGPVDREFLELRRQYPEWQPWLAVVHEILNETAKPIWDEVVPVCAGPQPAPIPLLNGATITLSQRSLAGLFERLIRTACSGATPKMSTLKNALPAGAEILRLFKASICNDGAYVDRIATDLGADAAAFRAVVDLVPLPLLHACNRRWTVSLAESWTAGYCPLCGAWPAFAEVRGIERSRYFRCARCGASWYSQCLFCPFCATADHHELVSLVPEKTGSNSVIDACKRCLGYVKTFTTLRGSPPEKIMIDDLASVDLDLAATQQGYRRPAGSGYSLEVAVMAESAARPSFFAWGR